MKEIMVSQTLVDFVSAYMHGYRQAKNSDITCCGEFFEHIAECFAEHCEIRDSKYKSFSVALETAAHVQQVIQQKNETDKRMN